MDGLILTDSDIEDLKRAFFLQAEEILSNLPQQIMAIENNPHEDNWRALKRSFHTLKGDSRAIGFNKLGTFAHKVEDLIADFESKGVDRGTIDLLLDCADAFEIFLEIMAKGKEPDISDIISKIESHIGSIPPVGEKEILKKDKINKGLSF